MLLFQPIALLAMFDLTKVLSVDHHIVVLI